MQKPIKWFLLASLCFASSLIASPYQEAEFFGNYSKALQLARADAHASKEELFSLEQKVLHLGSARLLFDENLQARTSLLNVLQELGTPETELLNSDKINAWAQENIFRKSENFSKNLQLEERSKALFPLFEKLGLLEEINPSFQSYDGALVHGALASKMRVRVAFLAKIWKKGIRFKNLYFLSGLRPLNPEETVSPYKKYPLKIRKHWTIPKKLPTNELELFQMIYDQADLPNEMRETVAVFFIAAPMKEDPATKKLLRPTTDDTIRLWLKQAPKGRYLAISNAPYIARQDLVERTLAPDYEFDTVGPKSTEEIENIVAELARLIFQTKQFTVQQSTEVFLPLSLLMKLNAIQAYIGNVKIFSSL